VEMVAAALLTQVMVAAQVMVVTLVLVEDLV
jgi:hypothetical protein